MKRYPVVLSALLFSLCLACSSKTIVTDWVPDSGSSKRGQQTFQSMGCFTCHSIADPAMPAPIAAASLRIPLDAQTASLTQSEIIAAIIAPTHLTPSEHTEKSVGSYIDVLTVQELSDLATFIKDIGSR